MSAEIEPRSFTFTVDAVEYTVAFPLVIRDALRLRTDVGITQLQLFEFLHAPDIDAVAVCVWLARLQAGETITLDDVAKVVNYASELSVGTAGEDHPES